MMVPGFWAACAEGRFVLPRCAQGHWHWSPQLICPTCLGPWAWSEASGLGKVYAFTVVHRAPRPGRITPYVIASIDLHEGVTMLSNIVDVPVADVSSGMAVEIVMRDGLPLFRPAV